MISDATIEELIAWGESQADIRAVLLTSTRATSMPTDAWSDYDVVLFCTDVRQRYEQQNWIRTFGNVVIAYWDSLEPDADSRLLTSGNVVYYPGTRKIDFTLWPVEMSTWLRVQDALPPELDAGYKVLLDKDDVTFGWPDATGHGYRGMLPNAETYLALVNDFFIGVPYVVTALLRGELLPARWVLDYDMRYVYLIPMMEWYAYTLHGEDIRIGVHGKGLLALLPEEVQRQLNRTYADMEIAANRAALLEMTSLFRDVAEKVGEAIGVPYPLELHQRVLKHIADLEATS